MGKTKSKGVPCETAATHKLNERHANVNKLIQRLNSRTESPEPGTNGNLVVVESETPASAPRKPRRQVSFEEERSACVERRETHEERSGHGVPPEMNEGSIGDTLPDVRELEECIFECEDIGEKHSLLDKQTVLREFGVQDGHDGGFEETADYYQRLIIGKVPCSSNNLVIHQKPLPKSEVQCTKLDPEDRVEATEDINVVMNKSDSIDYLIDLIVNQSSKREDELLTDHQLKRSQSHSGDDSKKKLMKLKSDQDEEEWEDGLMERLDNLEDRAQIFERRVNQIGSWLNEERKETEFEKNMKNVLEKSREECGSLEELKTIERCCTPVDSAKISAPKADPIIKNAIDKLVEDADEVAPYCCHSPGPSKSKTYCQACKKKCSGEVLRVQEKYFHISCFKCKSCKNSLAQGGFFCKDGSYFCTNDYQRQFGTKCAHCGQYVEGEVVTALGNTYHQKCFTCARCRQAFPSGERVTYTGKEVLCQKCTDIPVMPAPPVSPSGANATCAGCNEELKEGQALIALERQWHIWCFKCRSCETVLHGEYMGKDGVPYCEKDYQKQFGVKCAYCSRFISGKVLQAGDNHHFHPTCARCTKCGDPFGDGEEMYLQGGAIWHPRCGPGPTENGTVLNGSGVVENGHCTDTDGEMSTREGREFDRMSSSAVSETQFSFRSRTPSINGSIGSPSSASRRYTYARTGSPGLILREYKTPTYSENISRIYTYSYLTEEPSHGYLRRPIDPYDKPPTSPHFHRPSSSHSLRSSGSKVLVKTTSRSGMKVMADSIRSETPRPKSPHMNNEEPIELAHFPAAKKPKPGDKPKIERDDFPAPPYPYSDPERRKRYSGSYKGLSDDEEDQVDAKDQQEPAEHDKLKKEEEELTKIATGIGKVFLQNVKEREKMRQWKMSHMDPRNASRVPSAKKEPNYRLRYQSPVNASPSRNMDHPRPWEEDELDHSSSYRSSVGRSVGAIPSYNVIPSRTSSSRKAATLPNNRYAGSGYCSDYDCGYNGDFSFTGLDKTHSTDFSSAKSDISAGSISEVDRKALNAELPVSSTYQGLRYSSYSPHIRRSLPALSHMNNEPPKMYPYHLLLITNYRLPADVDRCNLERHLSDAEFEQLFQCARTEFYRMPTWRRNELKRRIKLF